MQLPHRVGRYVLERPLGRGGMAEVYRARLDDGGFEKAVCIKRVLPQLAGQLGFLDMFKDEAVLAARISHPNLVQALDLVAAEGTLWLVLELVEGTTLKRVLENCRIVGERMTVTHSLAITLAITRGLHHAHTAMSPRGEPLHVVHRDVSPDNILLGRAGEVKLGDFGVARASERLAARTATGAMKGKPGYMAPEQILGDPSDHRVDQFAMASVLWEMLALRPLFEGKSEMALAESVVACKVPPLASLRKDVPTALDVALAKALSKSPAARFPDMAAFEQVIAKELYARVERPGDVDVRALVERTDLEDSATVRMAVRQRHVDTDDAPQDTSPGLAPFADFDDKTSALAPLLSPLEPAEVTARLHVAHEPSGPTMPAAAAPARVVAPRMDRRLWIVLGATVAAGAVAASVTAAVAVRAMAPSAPVATTRGGVADAAPGAPLEAAPVEAAPAPVDEGPAVPVDSADLPADARPLAVAEAEAAAVAVLAAPAASAVRAKQARTDGELAAARKLILAGRIDAAVTALKAIVAAEPTNADAHRMLGVSYGKLGEPKRAAAHYKTYLALRPDAPDVDAVRAALDQRAP